MHKSVLALALLAACTVQREQPQLVGQDVRVTFLHTSDIHSRLIPYNIVPGRIDQNYGLGLNEGPYGGIARIGSIIKRERAASNRSIWLDSGDCFQGAPIFNLYKGEVEFRALSRLGLNAAVIGNHEFDAGANNLYEQMVNWAEFPLLAANYWLENPVEPIVPKLREVVQAFQIFDVDGVKVAAIGMANWSSLSSIFEGGNSLGIRPLDDAETVQTYVRLLRPAVDLIVLVSHLGLDEDEGLAPTEVQDENEALPLDGVDLIMGGHLHIVLNPPKIVSTDSYGHPTVLMHSGAFAKYVGRLDVVVKVGEDNSDPARRSYISAFTYENFPVSCGPRTANDQPCPNDSDPETVELLTPYSVELNQLLDLDGVFAYINTTGDAKIIRADPSGGDSQLGNLVARSMQRRRGVDADFALTNSLGIRADFEQGPLTLEQMYNVFPFENSITIMYLSGVEVQDTLDFVARKSSERGCRSQVQIAGLTFTMVCGSNPRATDVYLGDACRMPDGSIDTARCIPIIPEGLYRVAVNDYIAAGGSGFTVLKQNTSKQNTGISLRAALQDYIRNVTDADGNLLKCSDTELDLTTPDPSDTVLQNYGPITCLGDAIERHDERIQPRFE
jgi:2',3'-cyclic-nucleotide 2'-phosphodiesterase (5'-nucleotidase family)